VSFADRRLARRIEAAECRMVTDAARAILVREPRA
jgi:hypothetical protein